MGGGILAELEGVCVNTAHNELSPPAQILLRLPYPTLQAVGKVKVLIAVILLSARLVVQVLLNSICFIILSQ